MEQHYHSLFNYIKDAKLGKKTMKDAKIRAEDTYWHLLPSKRRGKMRKKIKKNDKTRTKHNCATAALDIFEDRPNIENKCVHTKL